MKIRQAIVGICASGMLVGGAAWAQSEQEPQTGQQPPQQMQMQMQQGSQGQMGTFKSNASAQVQKQLKQRTQEYQQAWNDHDTDKMLSFYTPDATLMNAEGKTATGKQEIKNQLQQDEQGPMGQAQAQLEVQSVRSITPTVALLDIQQTMTGMSQGAAQGPSQFHVSALTVKKGNQWQVAAVRAFPSPQQQQIGVGGAGQTGYQTPPPPPSRPQVQPAPQQPVTQQPEIQQPVTQQPLPQQPYQQPSQPEPTQQP